MTVTGGFTFGFYLGGVQYSSDRREASLTSGDGATQLVFTYTVVSSDSDSDGIWVGESGNPNDALFDPFKFADDQSITGPLGRNAKLTHPRLDEDLNHLVDGAIVSSNDANLSSLTIDGTGVTGFTAGTTSYTHNVETSVTQVTVAATASDSNASVEYSPADADTGTEGHQVDLSAGKNTVTVTVTAEDGTTTRIYTITITRAAPAPREVRSFAGNSRIDVEWVAPRVGVRRWLPGAVEGARGRRVRHDPLRGGGRGRHRARHHQPDQRRHLHGAGAGARPRQRHRRGGRRSRPR